MDKESILNSYNQNEYFEKAIISALNQTFKNFELIISENGQLMDQNTMEKYKMDTRIKI